MKIVPEQSACPDEVASPEDGIDDMFPVVPFPDDLPYVAPAIRRPQKRSGMMEAALMLMEGGDLEDLPSQLLGQVNSALATWSRLRAPQAPRAMTPLRDLNLVIDNCYPELGFSSAVDELGHRYALTKTSFFSSTPAVGQAIAAEVRNAFIVSARLV